MCVCWAWGGGVVSGCPMYGGVYIMGHGGHVSLDGGVQKRFIKQGFP